MFVSCWCAVRTILPLPQNPTTPRNIHRHPHHLRPRAAAVGLPAWILLGAVWLCACASARDGITVVAAGAVHGNAHYCVFLFGCVCRPCAARSIAAVSCAKGHMPVAQRMLRGTWPPLPLSIADDDGGLDWCSWRRRRDGVGRGARVCMCACVVMMTEHGRTVLTCSGDVCRFFLLCGLIHMLCSGRLHSHGPSSERAWCRHAA